MVKTAFRREYILTYMKMYLHLCSFAEYKNKYKSLTACKYNSMIDKARTETHFRRSAEMGWAPQVGHR